MTIEQYLKKCEEICDEHEGKVECKQCPLFVYYCGLPRKGGIRACLKLVKEYEAKKYPRGDKADAFVKCEKCNHEFGSELIGEHNIKHCPNCGQVLPKERGRTWSV